MKKTTALFLLSVLLLSSTSFIIAKRLLPQAQRTASKGKTSGVTVTVSFLVNKTGIKAVFSNLSIAKSVTYSFTYDSDAGKQGSDGSVDVSLASEQREFLFGTCSKGVCRYDTNIKNTKLVVTTILKTGKKVIKTFNIKV